MISYVNYLEVTPSVTSESNQFCTVCPIHCIACNPSTELENHRKKKTIDIQHHAENYSFSLKFEIA